MATALLMRLSEGDPTRLAWHPLGPGATAPGEGDLEAAAAAARGARVTLLVPTGAFLLTRVAVPSRKAQHVRMAVPYLLEEQVAEEVGALHFAVGARHADGTVAVAVVARARLQSWLDVLSSVGIVPARVYPDLHALPFAEDEWTLADLDDGLLLRRGDGGGMWLDGPDRSALLALSLAAADPAPVRIRVVGQAAAEAAASLPEVSRPDLVVEQVALAELLARGATDPAADAVDLLQGAFARDAGRRARWLAWRPPLALAACLVLLLVGLRVVEIRRLQTESAELSAALVASYREAFPDAKRVDDPVRLMRAHLRASGEVDESGFLDLIAAVGTTLKDQQKWQIAGLNYREGTLQVQLAMPAYEHFDRLRESFAGLPGLAAEIGSLGSVDGEVRGSLTLRRGGS